MNEGVRYTVCLNLLLFLDFIDRAVSSSLRKSLAVPVGASPLRGSIQSPQTQMFHDHTYVRYVEDYKGYKNMMLLIWEGLN